MTEIESTRQGKLVRDRIPEIVTATGGTARTRTLTPAEYDAALLDKLREELEEFVADGEMEELADLVEVIHAIVAARNLDWAAFEAIRLAKRKKRGGFDDRVWMDGYTPGDSHHVG